MKYQQEIFLDRLVMTESNVENHTFSSNFRKIRREIARRNTDLQHATLAAHKLIRQEVFQDLRNFTIFHSFSRVQKFIFLMRFNDSEITKENHAPYRSHHNVISLITIQILYIRF